MSSGCAKSGTPLNTSALTPVILNIKLQNLRSLYSYWTFKYPSLYDSVKSSGDQGKASWQMSTHLDASGHTPAMLHIKP
jgi:hypothetical protein